MSKSKSEPKANFIKEIKAAKEDDGPIIIRGTDKPLTQQVALQVVSALDYSTLEEMLYALTTNAKPKEWVDATPALKAWMGKSLNDRSAIKLLKRELKSIAQNGQLIVHSNYLGLGTPHYKEPAGYNNQDAIPTQYRNLSDTLISVAKVQ